MSKRSVVAAATAALFLALTTSGEGLKPFKDYVMSKEIYNVTLVKVKPNHIDDYLAGIKQTFAGGCNVGKKLGEVLDCTILVSTTPGNPDYNVLLMTRAASAALSDPDEARFNKVEAETRKQLAEDKERQLIEGYEELRTLVGDQDFRRVDFK